MPRIEKVITIFVGSPSDVVEERIILEEVVKDINHQWSKSLKIRFELLKWETDTHPDIGKYPQEVINSQIENDFDIFIGIFWTRFGTQTENAGSGTEEEYNRVYERYKNIGNVNICIYFKDMAVSISKIDPEQLAKINAFKSKIIGQGVLYCQFNRSDDFKNIIRSHLEQILQKKVPDTNSDMVTTEKKNEDQIEEERGLLDYVDIIYENIDNIKPILFQMKSDQELLQSGLNEHTNKLNLIHYSYPNSRGTVNRIINSITFELSNYNNKFKITLDQLSSCSDLIFTNFHRAFLIAKAFPSENDDQLAEIKNCLLPSIDQLKSFEGTIDSVISIIKTIPPIKSNFISAQKKCIGLMSKFKTIIQSILDSINIEYRDESIKR